MAKEIFIKYNPYRLQTEVTIDGNPVKQNSKFNVGEKRLQEWIDKLPEYVREEFNTRDVEIVFYGTKLDYEDLKEIADEANIKTKYLPAKEGMENKEAAIQAVFEKIQKGPFDALKSSKVTRDFEKAKNNEFEVNVVATMSSGKSTLINSLMRQKLMPTANKACTATITKISDNDSSDFIGKAYDKDENLVGKASPLTLDVMKEWNQDKEIPTIFVEGDIPFVDANEMNLVLIDTPGTNNSLDVSHKLQTYDALSKASMPMILYVMDATNFATTDDSELLKEVAKKMEVNGKQSRDRFIFAINKLDNFNSEDDSVEEIINSAKQYLDERTNGGIKNPNIYPISAATALGVRTILSKKDIDKDSQVFDDAIGWVKKLNRNKDLYFERYSSLPKSSKEKIVSRLNEEGKISDKDNALIHSGIPSVEEAIKIYVEKYAKTAKVKALVDSLKKHLEDSAVLLKIEEQITQNRSKRDEIQEGLELIERNIKDNDRIRDFEGKVNAIDISDQLNIKKQDVIKIAQRELLGIQESLFDKKELSIDEAKDLGKRFYAKTVDLQAKIQLDLQKIVDRTIEETAKKLEAEYFERLGSLGSEELRKSINLDLQKIAMGEISANINEIVSSTTKTKKEVDGRRWVENDNKRWYKPWTWFEEDGHYEDRIVDKKYILSSEFAEKFSSELSRNIQMNGNNAVELGKKNIENLKKEFKKRFAVLDKIIDEKIMKMKELNSDSKDIESKTEKLEKNRKWLEDVMLEIDAILDI